ncbi:aminotransferase class V-fold PLP-dependent enzyme [Mycoplasmopsis gallinarum]|uniref:Cysteine desulfurase, SufS subfamily n=1 Tax=Mycoplasmopsis gallinarum TaxID=29557 RepID=A0A168RBA4_9BACT|nr:aminotransferase class V-fold PLP-dependent enzyme [Mycoplasmopsis gallinarum]OAB48802.1 Cysteine desulfurase, SufS subfamily [Mycoplasmopsis gallinarum]
MKQIRNFFPLLKDIVYFDNSAMAQKPSVAIQKMNEFYTQYAVSTRTSESTIGIENKNKITTLRNQVRNLINANENDKIIFTSGATDSLNKIALMLKNWIQADDEILLSAYNHSSNIGPWINIANEKKAKVVFSENILADINPKTKIIAFSQKSNSLYETIDMKAIYAKAKLNNILIINDAAQAIISEPVDFKHSDVVAFSANKFYGPTGFGILAIKEELSNQLTPAFVGGGVVDKIDACGIMQLKNNDSSFEPGTPDLAAIYFFSESINFFNSYIGYDFTQKKLKELSNYAYEKLQTVPNLTLYNPKDDHIILFTIKNTGTQDIAHYLATKNIYVRSGIFCAQYLRNLNNNESFVRVSLGVYNTEEEIDMLVEALKEGGDFLVL